jgi:hypothetical protein
MSDEQPKKAGVNMKERVMGEIKSKKICMSSSGSIFARKLGLECAMVMSLLAGAFIISLAFYILKKTKILKFLTLGFPGLKVFLLSIPYGYVALFVGIIIVAIYISNKLDLSYETKISETFLYFLMLGAILILVIVFIMIGIHEYFGEISKNRIPKESAISGRIEEISGDILTVEEEDGQFVEIRLGKNVHVDEDFEDIKGKYIRAVGVRDPKDIHLFKAENVLCCDND